MFAVTVGLCLALVACALPVTPEGPVDSVPSETPPATPQTTVVYGSAIAENQTPAVPEVPMPEPEPPSLSRIQGPPLARISPEYSTHQRAAESNIWQRVRANMQWTEELNPRIQKQLDWYLRNPGYIPRVVERARPYLHHIVSEIERHNLPGELVFLPIVESAYRPFAYSFGRATGLWQFIPSTGKAFGLRQDWWYDGRRDVVASTDAAIRFFIELEQEFDGNWLHALAAYNAGPAKIRRAIKRNRKAGKPTSYWDLELPRETFFYVPKLLAVSELFKQPAKYNVDVPIVDDKAFFSRIDTQKQLDLSRAAELAGIDIETLYLLNPGFNRWATSPDGPHELLLPVDNAEKFAKGLAQIPDSERISWQRHKVKSGDTLSEIAARYNSSVSELKRVNRLRSHTIRIGQALMIPGPRESSDHYALSADQRVKSLQAKGSGTRHVHFVKSGDTLWDLARAYNSSIVRIARWNGLTPKSPLRLGQELVIWQQHSGASRKGSDAPEELRQVALKHAQQTIRYTVRRGDSLDQIANRFKIRVTDLIRWNSELKNAKYIHPGQTLRVKLDVRQQSG
ncbi:MAG: LysM peptidoglycan-binding domain-containing protein [Pseudomonadota bacterium]